MNGYLVRSTFGRGKNYFFIDLESAKKELIKHSKQFVIYKVQKISNDEFKYLGFITHYEL